MYNVCLIYIVNRLSKLCSNEGALDRSVSIRQPVGRIGTEDDVSKLCTCTNQYYCLFPFFSLPELGQDQRLRALSLEQLSVLHYYSISYGCTG